MRHGSSKLPASTQTTVLRRAGPHASYGGVGVFRWVHYSKCMKLRDAFKQQLETGRPLTEADLADDVDDGLPAIWHSVMVPLDDGNLYTSGRQMVPGDRLLIAYLVSDSARAKEIVLEESEIEDYASQYRLLRLAGKIPVLTLP